MGDELATSSSRPATGSRSVTVTVGGDSSPAQSPGRAATRKAAAKAVKKAAKKTKKAVALPLPLVGVFVGPKDKKDAQQEITLRGDGTCAYGSFIYRYIVRESC